MKAKGEGISGAFLVIEKRGGSTPVARGKAYPIGRGQVIIGRQEDCNFQVDLAGVNGTGFVGILDVGQSLLGVQGTGEVGSVGVGIELSGVSGTGQVGTQGTIESIELSGVSATGQVGSVGIAMPLSGVSATGAVGTISQAFAWNVIDNTQTANYTAVSTN